MLDRRDLRFWLGDTLKTWLGTLAGALGLWAACLVLAPERYTAFLLTPAALTFFLLIMSGLVTMINVSVGCRINIPLVIAFGATRRSTFAATRLTQLLPPLATLAAALLFGLLPGRALSPTAVLVVTAVMLGWTGVGDLLGMLGTRGGAWNTVAGLFVGISAGAFGGFISFNLTTGAEGLLNTLTGLRWTPAAIIVTAAALVLAAVCNLGARTVIRRMNVRF